MRSDAGVELELPEGARAVPEARRATARALRSGSAAGDGGPHPALVADAELVVTELVTNAWLHGAAPVRLCVRPREGGVRLEVRDAGRTLPERSRRDVEAMTGRGLGLVSALAASWGIDPAPDGGKVVWAELVAGAEGAAGAAGAAGPEDAEGAERVVDSEPEVDVDALLAAWHDDEAPERTWPVTLPAVPTALLAAAKEHVDNVLRELSLAAPEAGTAARAETDEAAALVRSVTRDFAEARAQLRRQAVQARRDGVQQLDVVLQLPASAADAGLRYLDALESADMAGRAGRLLSLETPLDEQVLRRWYVGSLVDQLRAQERGEPPPPAVPLASLLADEVRQVPALRRDRDRLELLQQVTSGLTAAATVEAMAEIVICSAEQRLGAVSGRVHLLGVDDVLRSVAVRGGTAASVAQYDALPLSADLPGPEVVRTGTALVLRGQAQLLHRYPSLRGAPTDERTLHVAPLVVGAHRLGVLSLAFPAEGSLGAQTEATFVRALADALAQAFERVQAGAQLVEARERLALLAAASEALPGSGDGAATADAVRRLLVPARRPLPGAGADRPVAGHR